MQRILSGDDEGLDEARCPKCKYDLPEHEEGCEVANADKAFGLEG